MPTYFGINITREMALEQIDILRKKRAVLEKKATDFAEKINSLGMSMADVENDPELRYEYYRIILYPLPLTTDQWDFGDEITLTMYEHALIELDLEEGKLYEKPILPCARPADDNLPIL